jgi:hypothetical protein
VNRFVTSLAAIIATQRSFFRDYLGVFLLILAVALVIGIERIRRR